MPNKKDQALHTSKDKTGQTKKSTKNSIDSVWACDFEHIESQIPELKDLNPKMRRSIEKNVSLLGFFIGSTQNPLYLYLINEKVQKNPDFFHSVVRLNPDAVIFLPGLVTHPEAGLRAVYKNPKYFQYLSESLRKDPEFIKEALMNYLDIYPLLDMKFKHHPEIFKLYLEKVDLAEILAEKPASRVAPASMFHHQLVWDDLKRNGRKLLRYPLYYQLDRDCVKIALDSGCINFGDLLKDALKDPEIILHGLKKGLSKHIPIAAYKNDQIAWLAISKNASAFLYANDHLTLDPDFIKAALEKFNHYGFTDDKSQQFLKKIKKNIHTLQAQYGIPTKKFTKNNDEMEEIMQAVDLIILHAVHQELKTEQKAHKVQKERIGQEGSPKKSKMRI